ncbi:MAG TPA: AAA family ATPase, partial [Ktedonobacteraceae bacterium]|nr:AAA family ATPase [Ktedonobacteraceae bacterium]
MNGKVTYRQHVSFCGKPQCRKCRDGIGHGPYWYAYQVVDGRSVRTYIGKHLPAETRVRENPPVELAPLEQADLHLEHGALSDAIDVLDRLLAIDPANEAAVQRLMMALARLKRRGEALQAYQRLTSILQKGYHALPTAETQALYEAVVRGDETIPLPPAPALATIQPSSQAQTEDALANRHKEFLLQRFPSPIQIGRTNQSPLVGRDTELAMLRQLLLVPKGEPAASKTLTRAVGANLARSTFTASLSHPQFMVLMGEAGIGKTRLAEEAAREASQNGWAVIWSNAYAQESGIPYRLWTEALRRVMAQGLWQEPELSTYQPLKALLPELQEVLLPEARSEKQHTSAYSSLAPEQEQLRLREAVYDLLTTTSAKKPLMIVLDDVQWADASSCELLGYVARRLPGHPIALLGTCRDVELSNSHPLRSLFAHMQREHAVEILSVQPLTDTQIGMLVSNLPQKTVRHIQTQAGGNPFFAEELASFFHAEATHPSSIHAHQTPAKADDASLPGTITAALDQRLNRLSAPCRQLLNTAAVLGSAFGFPLLAAIEANSADYDEDILLDLLEEALRSGILTEEGTGTRISYAFWHPLLATHLYNRISAAKRARLHRRAAEALQRAATIREDELAATIVQHLVYGGAEVTQIARYAELAANYAYNLSAYSEAERYYRLAVENTEAERLAHPVNASPEVRLHLAFLLERQAECTRIQGDFKQARALFERVLEMRNSMQGVTSPVDATLEAQIQALLWGEIGWTWRYTGDTAKARECCKFGEQLLRDAGISGGPAWARLRFQEGSLSWQEGNYEEARRAIEEALRLFEAAQPITATTDEDPQRLTRTRRTLFGDPVDLGRTYALLGAVVNASGQRTEALAHMNRALAIYEQYDRQREIAHACCNIGNIHLKKAEYGRADDFLQRSLNLAERTGDTPLLSVVFHNLGELASYATHLAEAAALYKRSLELAEQFNDREYLSLWNADLATILQEQGNLAEAKVCVGQALTIGRAIDNTPCIGLALVALGNLRIAQARAIRSYEKRSSGGGHEKPGPTEGRSIGGGHDESAPTRLLLAAKASLRHALALPGLEAETRTRGRLALAHVALLLGNR